MQPKIKSIDNIEIQNFKTWIPNNTNSFSIVFELLIGPNDSVGEEIFTIEVCTLEWFADFFKRKPKAIEKGYLIVDKYDYSEVINELEQICNSINGDEWNEIAEQLAEIFNWEFDNYIEYKG